MRRRRCGRGRRGELGALSIAFGLGLLFALFFSARFALCVAAVALIYIGITFRP